MRKGEDSFALQALSSHIASGNGTAQFQWDLFSEQKLA